MRNWKQVPLVLATSATAILACTDNTQADTPVKVKVEIGPNSGAQANEITIWMQEQNGSTWNNLSAAVNTDVPIGSGGYEFTFDTAVSGRMYVVYNKGGGDGMVALCNADIANAECTAMSDFTECPKFFAESGCQSMLLPYALVEMTLAPNANSGDANLSDVDQHGIEVSMEVTTGTDTSRHNYNTSNANVLNGLKALLPTDSKAVVTNNSGDIVRVINPSHLPASANYAEIPQEYPSFKSYVDSLGADWSAQISSKVEDQEACPGAVGSFDMVATVDTAAAP